MLLAKMLRSQIDERKKSIQFDLSELKTKKAEIEKLKSESAEQEKRRLEIHSLEIETTKELLENIPIKHENEVDNLKTIFKNLDSESFEKSRALLEKIRQCKESLLQLSTQTTRTQKLINATSLESDALAEKLRAMINGEWSFLPSGDREIYLQELNETMFEGNAIFHLNIKEEDNISVLTEDSSDYDVIKDDEVAQPKSSELSRTSGIFAKRGDTSFVSAFKPPVSSLSPETTFLYGPGSSRIFAVRGGKAPVSPMPNLSRALPY
jgi:hypothetical protein